MRALMASDWSMVKRLDSDIDVDNSARSGRLLMHARVPPRVGLFWAGGVEGRPRCPPPARARRVYLLIL